jgi:hypothetical protein
MKKLVLAFSLFTALVLSGCSSGKNLISGGRSEYKIYVSKAAAEPEKYAARELQKYLRKISGYSMEITHQAGVADRLIYVGFSDAPESWLKEIRPADFKNEEYLIRSDGENLLIAGGGNRGTLYGVLGYLSDHLGCRWYTNEVIEVPEQKTIVLNKIEDRQKPSFSYREVCWREAYNVEWSVHNRVIPSRLAIPDSVGGSFVIYPTRGHTFYLLLPPEKYFASHPEYFSQVNGVRVSKEGQLCLTNPEVLKIATAKVFEWIKENPNATTYSVTQNDGEGYCECKNCKKVDDAEESHAGTLLHFVNKIADSVRKVYPDVKLQTFAYAYTEAPPKTVRPADNILVELCHYNYCSAHALESCSSHKTFTSRLERWFAIADKVTVWDYCTNFANYLMPFPNFETFKKDVKYYKDHKAYGLYAEGANTVGKNGGGEFGELRSWVFSQLMWNADRDAQALIDEFVTHVYGSSAKYISQYISLLHDQVKPDSVYFSIWSIPMDMNYLNPQTIQKADSLFTLARKAADGDTALLKRIELAYLPIIYTKLSFYSVGGSAYVSREKAGALITDFEDRLKEKEITDLNVFTDRAGSLEAFLSNARSTDKYLTDWWIIGPFDNPGLKGLSTAFPPEQSFDPEKTYAGKNGMRLAWKKHHEKNTGYINFSTLFSPSEEVVAYAFHKMNLPEAKTMHFGVGSNDGVRVWINGKLVLDRPVSRRADPNQDLIDVPMKKGENTILVKVDQLKRGWGFYFTEKH